MDGHWMGSFGGSTIYVFAQGGNDTVMVLPSVHVATVIDGGGR